MNEPRPRPAPRADAPLRSGQSLRSGQAGRFVSSAHHLPPLNSDAVYESVNEATVRSEAMVRLDHQWRYLEANDLAIQFLKVDRADLIGRRIDEIFPETRENGFLDRLVAIARSGQTLRFEYFHERNDDWYECICHPSDGGLSLFFTSVTTRNRTRELLSQQAELLELSHDAIIVSELCENGDGWGINYWNRGASLLYGYDHDEVVGKHVNELLQTEHPLELSKIMKALRCDGQWSGTLRQRARDGRLLTLTSRYQLIKRRTDGRELIFEVNRDLTEERRLNDRVQQLAAIADTTTDLVATCDTSGRIVFVNRGGREMLGYPSATSLVGAEFGLLYPTGERECIVNDAMPVAAAGEVWNGDSHLRCIDGTLVPVSQVMLAHFGPGGQPTHYSVLARDISDQKEHQRRLEKMTELAESASRAKSAFLAQMSHELRTPMTAILGCAEQLNESARTAEDRQLTRVLRDQSRALLAILDDVLDLSRVEADRLDLSLSECSVVEMLRDLRQLMLPRADALGLSLRLAFVGSIPRRILTDPVRFRQIVLNLLSNAFKYTHQGSVTLSAEVTESDESCDLAIRVADTGKGIPPEQLPHIFDAFNRGSPGRGQWTEGAGLGLTIVDRVTRMLGGTVEVQSQLNVGSTFTVTLPLKRSDCADWQSDIETVERMEYQALPAVAPDKLRRLRVLVVEDTSAIQLLLRRILSPLVKSLGIASEGQQALEAIESADREGVPYDVILMDMQMPVMSGLEATRELRRRGSTVPIIALTAGAMDADREQCLQAGCDHFLTKPIDRSELYQSICRYTRV